MSSHFEEVQTRSYNPGPVKTRATKIDWASAPAWWLLNITDVMEAAGLSKTGIQDRIKNGSFPAPGRDGKRRVWTRGAIREWCRAVAEEVWDG